MKQRGTHRLANDSPSFTPVHPQIRAIGPRDLHLWKGRGRLEQAREVFQALQKDRWFLADGTVRGLSIVETSSGSEALTAQANTVESFRFPQT